MSIEFRPIRTQEETSNVRHVFWRRPTTVSRAIELSAYVLLAIGIFQALEYGIDSHYLFIFGLLWLYMSLTFLASQVESNAIDVGVFDVKSDSIAIVLLKYSKSIFVVGAMQVILFLAFFVSPSYWALHPVFMVAAFITIPVLFFIRSQRDKLSAKLVLES